MKSFDVRDFKTDMLTARALRSRSRRADIGAFALSAMGVYGVFTDNWRMAGAGIIVGFALLSYGMWLSARARALSTRWDRKLP